MPARRPAIDIADGLQGHLRAPDLDSGKLCEGMGVDR